MDNTQMTLETQDSLIISNALRTLSLFSSPMEALKEPIRVYNVDGTPNK